MRRVWKATWSVVISSVSLTLGLLFLTTSQDRAYNHALERMGNPYKTTSVCTSIHGASSLIFPFGCEFDDLIEMAPSVLENDYVLLPGFR